MRLLHTDRLTLKDFSGQSVPQYVILSHTWGDEEVTFADISGRGTITQRRGGRKLLGCCKQARLDGYDWIWVDTCCIDKSSSAELSEAINSMYRWYQNAHICYAYLSDVDHGNQRVGVEDQIRSSRWFSRGWTLQEIIAPDVVEFYDAQWRELGTKSSLTSLLHDITGIDIRVLAGAPPAVCNIAYRISWAASRQTTREEDMAYSLLGLLGVNMPLLYGEGPNAFKRLQEEVIKETSDYTVLAWRDHEGLPSGDGLLEPSPKNFCRSTECQWCSKDEPWLYRHMTSRPLAPAKSALPGTSRSNVPVFGSGRLRLTLPLRRPSKYKQPRIQGSSISSSCDSMVYTGYVDAVSNQMLCLRLGPDWEDASVWYRKGLARVHQNEITQFTTTAITFVSWRRLASNMQSTVNAVSRCSFCVEALPPCLVLDAKRREACERSTQSSNMCFLVQNGTDAKGITLQRSQGALGVFLHRHGQLVENVLVKVNFTKAAGGCVIVVMEDLEAEPTMQHILARFSHEPLKDRAQVVNTTSKCMISVAIKRRPGVDAEIPNLAVRLTCEERGGRKEGLVGH